ncbi:MAG: hypothetical protein WCF67_25350 [Chitinophagaceae bacterium]
MKKITLLFALCALAANSFAQKEIFDLATYTAPKSWKKEKTENAIQFSKENANKGTYCHIILYKAIPGTANAKENFDLAWSSLVKEMVTVFTAPEMQPAAAEDGWEVHSGYSPFESDGNKGIVVLVTSSGFKKMINLIILTNTDEYEKEVTNFIESIDIKQPPEDKNNNAAKSPVQKSVISQPAIQGKFAFNITNFDDGWTATEQADWVTVTKDNIKVLIHYPKEGTIFPADPEPLTTAAWNILVAPRYSNLRNYKTAYITSYNRPYLGMGTATENASGKDVFIVLYRQGETGWLEFIAPDKNSFIQNFKFDPETIRWDSETDLLKPMAAMVNYNKFAIAASDFTGTWTSDFTGLQQLYHVYTGNYAGMNVHQSNQEFIFSAGNSYNWRLLVVNGMVGNMKYTDVKSSGKFSVPNNWQIHFSKIESKAKTYHAHWSCIKGARLLKLLDAEYAGSGIYDVYGKK